MCCLTHYYSDSESQDSSKRWNLGLKGYGVSFKKKKREEDGSDVPRKDKKSVGEDKSVKVAL